MKRILALLAGVFLLQGCTALDQMSRGIERQTQARKQLAVTKMHEGLRKFDHGQNMVSMGVTLNKQVAVQQGLQDKWPQETS